MKSVLAVKLSALALIAIGGSALLISIGSAPAKSSRSATWQKRIENVLDGYRRMARAYSARDAKEFMSCFSQDVVASGLFFRPYSAERFTGQLGFKDIEDSMIGWAARYSPANPKMPAPWIEYLPLQVLVADGKTTVSGYFYLVQPRSPSGEDGNVDGTFGFTDVWVRQNGEWKCKSSKHVSDEERGRAAFANKANASKIIRGQPSPS